MPLTNNPTIDEADLSDFFGGAWDFAPNGTFSDLTDSTMTMPTLDQSEFQPSAAVEVLPSPSDQNPTKAKPPNLYEALRRAQMMPQLMLSPYSGYNEMLSNMDWSPQLMTGHMDFNSAGVNNVLYSTSPTMLDPAQLMLMQRMKRPRVSPILGSSGLDQTFIPPSYSNGMNLFSMGLFGRRPAKMPLSPINKTEKKIAPPDPNDKMPIVLPFASSNINSRPKVAPIKLLPAKNVLSEAKKPASATTLEENIEKNLRSFLRDTKDLEWENVTVIELKRILRQYELNATGKKAELMQRIEKIRKTYRHLEETTDSGTVEERKSVRANGKTAESSPDTMGSDNGINGINGDGNNLTVDSLDSLFSNTLDIPAGQDMLFS